MERSSRSSRSSSASAGAASASSISPASSGTTTRSATRSATGSSSASRASCPTRSAPRTSSRSSASSEARDLHARFGGDEFCFLIPDLPGCAEAVDIAERFKAGGRGLRLGNRGRSRSAAKPVRVDVGVVCLRLGPVAERRGVARKLAAELIHRADTLMYEAKSQRLDARPLGRPSGWQDSALVDAGSPSPATIEKHPGGGAGLADVSSVFPFHGCYTWRFCVTRASGCRRVLLPAHGGCSSAVERRTVAPEVAGSNPVIHPKFKLIQTVNRPSCGHRTITPATARCARRSIQHEHRRPAAAPMRSPRARRAQGSHLPADSPGESWTLVESQATSERSPKATSDTGSVLARAALPVSRWPTRPRIAGTGSRGRSQCAGPRLAWIGR